METSKRLLGELLGPQRGAETGLPNPDKVFTGEKRVPQLTGLTLDESKEWEEKFIDQPLTRPGGEGLSTEEKARYELLKQKILGSA